MHWNLTSSPPDAEHLAGILQWRHVIRFRYVNPACAGGGACAGMTVITVGMTIFRVIGLIYSLFSNLIEVVLGAQAGFNE